MRRALCFVTLIGCASSGAPPAKTATATAASPSKADPAPAATAPAPSASLYDRLGGKPAITAVVDEFYGRVAADKAINQRFFNVDTPRLRGMLIDFVCAASGGPCQYGGRDMKSAHAGMDLVDEEWNALVGDLKGALDKFKVPAREQGELLGALGPLKPQIVVAPGTLKPLDAAKLDAAKQLAPSLKSPEARELLEMAVLAGSRGQRSYAEQLFSRAELAVGPEALASVAGTFRAGAPPRVTTALTKLPADTPPQPATVGNSDEDAPDKKPARGSLRGAVTVGGAAVGGFAVVMLEPASGKFAKRAPKKRLIEQRGRQFAPRVMAVPVGSTVSFPNFDGIFHNVFSLSSTHPFDLGLYKNGETREVTFDKEGVVQLGCNLHSNMSAYLLVVAAPHYAVVDTSGAFFFKSLAPGKYKVKTWTDRSANPSLQTVTIKPGENKLAIDLKADAPPVASLDKFGAPRTAAQ